MATEIEIEVERKKYPPYLYRHLDRPEYAQNFAEGRIWISTLRACRKYEHEERGDSDEGIITYRDDLLGDGADPDFRQKAEAFGIRIGEGASVNIRNAWITTTIYDAYVLCLTDRCDHEIGKDFGPHCVRIHDPVLFAGAVTRALHERVYLPRADMGSVNYDGREFSGQPKPRTHNPVYLKPVRYASQREYRIAWYPNNLVGLTPFILDVPEAVRFCSFLR